MREKTKEAIKNRMVKRAATLWGIPANEIEMSFDPIVSMLLSACASEMEKLTAEMDASQTRITEKLIQLMTPEAVYGPKPAHAILYSEPIDSKHEIKPEYEFSFKQESVHNHTSLRYRDISFSPIGNFNLVNAKVKYLVSGGKFTEVEEGRNVNILSDLRNSGHLDNSTMYLGLLSDERRLDLSEVSFYFELPDPIHRSLFYHHLRNANWYVEDSHLTTHSGFANSLNKQKVDLDHIFEDVSNNANATSQVVINN